MTTFPRFFAEIIVAFAQRHDKSIRATGVNGGGDGNGWNTNSCSDAAERRSTDKHRFAPDGNFQRDSTNIANVVFTQFSFLSCEAGNVIECWITSAMTSDNKEQDSIGNNTLLLRFVVPSPYDWQNAIIITTDKKLHKVSVNKNKMYAIKTCSFRLLLNPALVLLTHKSCVMTKKGFEGIKPVAGSYLGLLPTVCILSGHRTIIRPISWPATFPTSKDISPRSHCWVSWAYRTDFCIWHLAHHHFTSWFSQGTKFTLKHDNIVDTIGTLLVTHSYPSFRKRCIWQKFSLLYKLPKR